MADNKKYDRSDCFIYTWRNSNGEKEYYVAQLIFCNKTMLKEWDMEEEQTGYYATLVNCKIDSEGKPYDANVLFSDLKLLVACGRRSQKNYELSMEKFSETVYSSIEIMEKDRELMRTMGATEDEIDNIIKKIREEYEQEKIEKENNMPMLRAEPLEKKDKKEEEKKSKKTFKDVCGMQEVKNKLYDVVDQLNNKEKYEEWGIEPINGMILYGVGGTGKSLLSEALAGEIDADFIKISTSDIMDKYVGSSQQNVRKIFEKARKADKCVLMIDEADGIFAKRNGENNKEHNNVVNEFLYQLSNGENKDIFVIATTNRIDIIDESIKRSGRFDYKIEITLPDYETRKGILELNAKKKPLADDVDFDKIAKNMAGMNGADCALLINESARKVLREKRDLITQADFEFTLEEMVCGLASKSKKLDEKTKMTVACHEVGHLLANELLGVNKTKKVSVLPHGEALGYLLHTNENSKDVFLHDKKQLEDRVKVMLAGRVNEEIFFNKATTGASDDLQKANSLVRMMITKYGYSEELGLLVVNDTDISLQNKVNDIIKNELDRLYKETRELLEKNKELSKVLIDELYIKEELNGKEVEKIINN
jgi:cell division protease FtsH